MLTINICVGTACHMKGAYMVIDKLQTMIRDRKIGEKVTINGAFCLGQCSQKDITVKLDDNEELYMLSEKNLEEFLENIIIPRI